MRRLFLLVLLAAIALPHSSALAEEKEQRLRFWGDFRGRWEGFRFSQDETGSKREKRSRIRYRFRFNAKAKLDDHAAFEARIGTGDLDQRTANQTLGSPFDFSPNEFDVRRAYLIYYPWANGGLPNRDGSWAINFGRVPNPTVWKNGKDMMLWDNDINLAGLSTTFEIALSEPLSLFANTGYYVIAENSSGYDPWFSNLQAGLIAKSGDTAAGIRGTFYYFDELDTLFVKRGVDGTGGFAGSRGNVPDGLTGGDSKLQVAETQAFVRVTSWPLLIYGGYSLNLSAETSQLYPEIGKENMAYNLGGEVGKKTVLKVGAAWYYLEANAFPSQFVDSDMLDGATNRDGLLVYLQRQVVKDVNFNVQAFSSNAINTDANLNDSIVDSERLRLQVDVSYNF